MARGAKKEAEEQVIEAAVEETEKPVEKSAGKADKEVEVEYLEGPFTASVYLGQRAVHFVEGKASVDEETAKELKKLKFVK